jgi:hypothetical protein
MRHTDKIDPKVAVSLRAAGLLELAWSELVPLTEHDIRTRIPDHCGVYRIHAFTRSGKPCRIPRCNKVDDSGTLHVGESLNLRAHVLRFLAAAESGRWPFRHSAGGEYYSSKFCKRFPLNQLRCEFLSPLSQAKARELKRDYQRRYRKIFLDNPPLDAGIGANTLSEPAAPPEVLGPRFRAHEGEDA